MYNRNSILFQQAVSEGRISSEMLAELEQKGLLVDGPGPQLEFSLEDRLAGLENPEEDDTVFTDVHGRTLLEQYPPEMAQQQPINQLSPGDRAKVAMNMRAQAFASNQYTNNINSYQNPYGYYGTQPQQNDTMPNTLYISYDDVYGANRYAGNPYARYMNMYNQNQYFQPENIDMVNKEENENGYTFKVLVKDSNEKIVPFSKEFEEKCNYIAVNAEQNETRYENPFINVSTMYGTNPYMQNSLFNGYQSVYQNAIMQQREQTLNGQLGIIKKLCKCTSVYTGSDCPTDEQIKNKIIHKYEDQTVKGPVIDKNPIQAVIVTYDEDGNIVDEVVPNSKNKYVYNRESEAQNFNRMALWYFNGIPYNVPIQNSIIAYNKKYDEIKAKYPDSMGLVEFLENSGPLYNDMLMRESYRKHGHYAVNLVEASKFNKAIEKDKAQYDQGCNDYHLRDMSGQFSGMFKNDEEYTKYTGISYDDKNGVLNITAPEHIRRQHPEMLSEEERILYEDNQDVMRRLKVQSSSLYEQRSKAFHDFIISEKATATDKRRGD